MRIQYPKSWAALITVFSFHICAYCQNAKCTLDIGGEDSEIIVQIFQLNEQQQILLNTWRGELQLQSKPIEDDIRQLLDSHPQSTESDLMNLAKKYAGLKDQLVHMSEEYDQKLLGIFNNKQYEFYKELCEEAFRTPMNPIPQEEKEEDP